MILPGLWADDGQSGSNPAYLAAMYHLPLGLPETLTECAERLVESHRRKPLI